MMGEYAVAAFIFAGVTIAALIGFTFTPLTERDAGSPSKAKAVVSTKVERSYCEANLQGVDCTCFARKAGVIMESKRKKIPGAHYADAADLARAQAAGGC